MSDVLSTLTTTTYNTTLRRFTHRKEHVTGSSKIPTMLYYDKDGGVRAVSAETLTEGIYEMAEESGWMKVKWFVGFFIIRRQSTK